MSSDVVKRTVEDGLEICCECSSSIVINGIKSIIHSCGNDDSLWSKTVLNGGKLFIRNQPDDVVVLRNGKPLENGIADFLPGDQISFQMKQAGEETQEVWVSGAMVVTGDGVVASSSD